MAGVRSILRVGVLGVNFKTADLYLREAIAKGAQSLAGEKSLFFPHPTVLLSTCNRTEIYYSAEDLARAQGDLLSLLSQHIALPFEHHLYSYFGAHCFAHLSKVSAGLDSAILAETEIQHQVKMAYARAAALLSLPAPLHYLFQKSLHIAKWLRNRNLKLDAPSLFGALWQLAEKSLGGLTHKQILLVGYSEIHRGFASFLEHKGISSFTFCTRHPEKVPKARVCNRDELQRWRRYDLISCASPADDFLIRGPGRPGQLLFDLSVPRNIDPSVALGGAHLYNIDQLTAVKEEDNPLVLNTLDDLLWEKVERLAQAYLDKSERSLFACP